MLAPMDTPVYAQQDAFFQLPPLLDVSRADGCEVVHVGWTPIAQYPTADVTTRRHVMVQLAEAGRLPGQEIARCFGVTPVYVSQGRKSSPIKLDCWLEEGVVGLSTRGFAVRGSSCARGPSWPPR